jgi:membrane protein YqaA with SNARE-associated domain
VELLSLIGVSFIGAIVAIGMAEASAVYAGTTLGWNPLLVGLICASSQCAMHFLVYRFGDWLVARWAWLKNVTERTRERLEDKAVSSFLGLSALGAVIGTPPILAMLVIAPGFRIPLAPLLTVAFGGRFIRYSLCAWLGERLQEFML